MNLVEFFGTVIKPRKVKGKKMMAPVETSSLDENVYFLRDKDVNAFLIKSNKGYIAIDSGYKNSQNMINALEKLNIDPNNVKHVLLTHLDLDHAGGLDKRCRIIYPNAKIYLGEEEAKYLTKEYARKKILGIKLGCPIKLNEVFTYLKDHQHLNLDGVDIEVIFSPGHTLGHLSYLINDKYLFVGDTLILNKNGGYCFWNFWNADSNLNKQSLFKLSRIASERKVKYVITSHNGYTNNIKVAFKHIDEMIKWNKKGFIFDENAPEDPYMQ